MTQQSPPSTQDDFLAVQFPVGLTETGTNVCAVVQLRVLVHARLCLGSSAWCASFLSNFLSTCARLNCFLYVIDSHLIWTPSLFLFWHFPPRLSISILSALVYTLDGKKKNKNQNAII